MKTNVKRLIAVFLAVVMMVTALPLTAIPVSAASKFHITSHDDGETVSSGWVTFEWSTYSGAHHYWLTVVNMDSGAKIQNSAIYDTEYSMILSDEDTEYKVYAAAMDANGDELDNGSAWEVIYIYTASDGIEVSKDELEFDAAGGSKTFKITASSAYTISESLSWITLSSTSGSADKTITVTCKANTSTSDRDGRITVTHKSSGDKLYIDVYQEGQVPEIDVSEDYLEFSADGGTDTFKVYAEDAYTISESLSWISLSSTSGSSDKTITVTCSKNTSASSREGTITVKQTSTGEKITIDVYQEGVTVQKKAPSVELTVSDTEIELGESFTYSGTAYGNDYKLNTVTVGISYFTSESNYESGKGNTVYLRNPNLSTSSKSVEKTVYTGSGKYITGTNNTGSESFTLYFDKVGIYTVTLHGYSEEYGTDVNDFVRIDVVAPAAPEILDITVSSDPVSVGEEFTISVKTNSSAYGVILYCDDMGWIIGDKVNRSSTNIYTFAYTFEKTNKTDADGYDVTNTRKILAYPYDSAGNIVTDSESMGDYNITVNPAEYEFPDFDIEAVVTMIGNSATIKWDALTTENGATVYYNLWIDNEVVAEDLTSNSYMLSAAQVEKLGVGAYGIMVMATAKQYRMRQSTDGLTIEAKLDIKVYPGDVNGDGITDGTDVTRLKKYLANYDETDPAKQSVVNPVGADVNGDGKINGKDLNALYVKLENGNIEIPEPEPEPDIPSILPAVKHTYTVKIPLDKADLKATTGRTIYLMPKYGYVKLVAYDETGKEVKLNQAGITVDISNANGVVTFDGFTLKAVKGGYGFISYTQTVNGKKTTTEIAIHVGESNTSSSKWPSTYQYIQEEYEYVSKALDLFFTMYKADMPTQYADVDMELWEIAVSSTADVSNYIKLILQGKLDEKDAYLIKDGLAPFIKQYGEQIYSSEEVNEATNRAVGFLCCIFEYVPKATDILNNSLGIDKANLISNAWAAFEAGTATDRHLEIIVEFADELANNKSLLDKFLDISEISGMWKNLKMTPGLFKDAFKNIKNLKNSEMWKSMVQTLTDKKVGAVENKLETGVKVVNYGVAFVKAIAYGVADYNNSIKVLNAMRDELTHYYGAEDVEIRAINILLDEYENQWCTAFSNLAWNLGIDAIIGKAGGVWAIVDFAANIINDAAKLDTKKEIMMLVFYVCGSGKTISDITNIFTTGQQTKTLDELNYFASLYFNMVLYQNQLALEVASNSDKIKIQAEIDQIKSMFKTYLEYKVPITSSFN